MTIKDALYWAINELNRFSVEGVESSANFLLANVLNKDKSYIVANSDIEISKDDYKKFQGYIERRAKHEPVWYITGQIEFFGQIFSVDNDVLIPRPETELLIERIVVSIRSGFLPRKVLDVGTGSGAIILTLAENLLNSKNFVIPTKAEESSFSGGISHDRARDDGIYFFASDISKAALGVAKRNAVNLGFVDNIDFRHGDLFEPWGGMKFDLIVANLPYVPDGDVLAPDLVNHEPILALFGGEDGMDVIRKFLAELPNYLEDGAKVYLEIGYDQGRKILEILKKVMPDARVEILGDYANVDRIVIIET